MTGNENVPAPDARRALPSPPPKPAHRHQVLFCFAVSFSFFFLDAFSTV